VRCEVAMRGKAVVAVFESAPREVAWRSFRRAIVAFGEEGVRVKVAPRPTLDAGWVFVVATDDDPQRLRECVEQECCDAARGV